jgi:hypothetical protein
MSHRRPDSVVQPQTRQEAFHQPSIRHRRKADRGQGTVIRRIRLAHRNVRDAAAHKLLCDVEQFSLVCDRENHGIRVGWKVSGAGFTGSMHNLRSKKPDWQIAPDYDVVSGERINGNGNEMTS